MKKKIEDCTVGELIEYCKQFKTCEDCTQPLICGDNIEYWKCGRKLDAEIEVQQQGCEYCNHGELIDSGNNYTVAIFSDDKTVLITDNPKHINCPMCGAKLEAEE